MGTYIFYLLIYLLVYGLSWEVKGGEVQRNRCYSPVDCSPEDVYRSCLCSVTNGCQLPDDDPNHPNGQQGLENGLIDFTRKNRNYTEDSYIDDLRAFMKQWREENERKHVELKHELRKHDSGTRYPLDTIFIIYFLLAIFEKFKSCRNFVNYLQHILFNQAMDSINSEELSITKDDNADDNSQKSLSESSDSPHITESNDTLESSGDSCPEITTPVYENTPEDNLDLPGESETMLKLPVPNHLDYAEALDYLTHESIHDVGNYLNDEPNDITIATAYISKKFVQGGFRVKIYTGTTCLIGKVSQQNYMAECGSSPKECNVSVQCHSEGVSIGTSVSLQGYDNKPEVPRTMSIGSGTDGVGTEGSKEQNHISENSEEYDEMSEDGDVSDEYDYTIVSQEIQEPVERIVVGNEAQKTDASTSTEDRGDLENQEGLNHGITNEISELLQCIDLRVDDLPGPITHRNGTNDRNEDYFWPNFDTSYTEIEVTSNNTAIYAELRRMEEILGYFSSGNSIEVYVDTTVTDPDVILTEICQRTGESPEKFHIRDNEEQFI